MLLATFPGAALLPSLPVAAGAQLIPASAETARDRLNGSPRHGEWASVPDPGGVPIESWIVYPERSDPAPVVMVIHEIYGLTDWIRSVADELAAAGFIAIAPDLLSGEGPDGGGTASVDRDGAVALVRGLEDADVDRRLRAVAGYATSLPAARAGGYGVVGFCWGGSTSFRFATVEPGLSAAVVYYGSSPETSTLDSVEAPVLGLYGGDDARVNATIPEAEARMNELGKTYEVEIFDGAGHGFLRAQEGRDGRNLAAAAQAWPRTVRFFRARLGG